MDVDAVNVIVSDDEATVIEGGVPGPKGDTGNTGAQGDLNLSHVGTVVQPSAAVLSDIVAKATIADSAQALVTTGANAGEVTQNMSARLNLNVLGLRRNFGLSGDPTEINTMTKWLNAAGAGKIIEAEHGTFVLPGPLPYITGSSAVFSRGFHLIGRGEFDTIIDYRGSGAMINIDTLNASRVQYGVELRNFSVMSTVVGTNAEIIRLRRTFFAEIEHVNITGGFKNGIVYTLNQGDPDGSAYPSIKDCRISLCKGWGVLVDVTGAFNEISFLLISHVNLDRCGLLGPEALPLSGGMCLTGQQIMLEGGGSTQCNNVALYIPGKAGGSTSVNMYGVTWENTIGNAALQIGGIAQAIIDGCVIHQNSGNVARYGIMLDASLWQVSGVIIKGQTIRCPAAVSPYTAFYFGPLSIACKEEGVFWQDFWWPGQVDFDNQGSFNEIQSRGNMFVQRPSVNQIALSNKTFTVDTATNELVCNLHRFIAGETFQVQNTGGALPAALAPNTPYLTREVTANRFKVTQPTGGSNFYGGPAIDLTADAGTGTHSFTTSYTPNANRHTTHFVRMMDPGVNYTVNAPTFLGGQAEMGAVLRMKYVNDSGGTITMTRSGSFKDSGFVVPPNGVTRSMQYSYHPVRLWEADGGWS